MNLRRSYAMRLTAVYCMWECKKKTWILPRVRRIRSNTHTQWNTSAWPNEPANNECVQAVWFPLRLVLCPNRCWQASVHLNSGHTSARTDVVKLQTFSKDAAAAAEAGRAFTKFMSLIEKKSFKRSTSLCESEYSFKDLNFSVNTTSYWRFIERVFPRWKKGTVHLICNLTTSKAFTSMKRTWFGSEILLNVGSVLLFFFIILVQLFGFPDIQIHLPSDEKRWSKHRNTNK